MDFYYHQISAPCRAVMLTAKAAGVALNKKFLDLMADEHKKPEFVAINPQHCVPTIVDGDFVLWESRPICVYLATKYGPESLYPKDIKTRAEVDKLLYFDMGTLYHRYSQYAYPVMLEGVKPDEGKLEKLHEALGWLNTFLEGHSFAVGNNITVADHSLIATVSSIEDSGIDVGRHANVAAWVARCKSQMPGYDTENDAGSREFGKWFINKLPK